MAELSNNSPRCGMMCESRKGDCPLSFNLLQNKSGHFRPILADFVQSAGQKNGILPAVFGVFCPCVPRTGSGKCTHPTAPWKRAHKPNGGHTPRLPRTPRIFYAPQFCETCEACETGGMYCTLTTLPLCSSLLEKVIPRSCRS